MIEQSYSLEHLLENPQGLRGRKIQRAFDDFHATYQDFLYAISEFQAVPSLIPVISFEGEVTVPYFCNLSDQSGQDYYLQQWEYVKQLKKQLCESEWVEYVFGKDRKEFCDQILSEKIKISR